MSVAFVSPNVHLIEGWHDNSLSVREAQEAYRGEIIFIDLLGFAPG